MVTWVCLCQVVLNENSEGSEVRLGTVNPKNCKSQSIVLVINSAENIFKNRSHNLFILFYVSVLFSFSGFSAKVQLMYLELPRKNKESMLNNNVSAEQNRGSMKSNGSTVRSTYSAFYVQCVPRTVRSTFRS